MTRKELAEAMRRGATAPDVAVHRYDYIDLDLNLCWACALGCALIGKYDGDYRKARDEFNQKRSSAPSGDSERCEQRKEKTMPFNAKEHLGEEVKRLRKQAQQLAEFWDYAGAAAASAQADGINYAIGVMNGVDVADRIHREVRVQAERQSDSFDPTQVASMAELLNISTELADEIEMQHLGGKSIEQVASWLESEDSCKK